MTSLLMEATRNQRTIAAPASVSGVGYWTGRPVRVEFRPAPADAGIAFVRADLEGFPRIPATIDHRFEIPRRTSLRSGEATVEMVEHIMAALHGLLVDNCDIWVNQPEMPGCDGSSLPFVEAIENVGIVEQNAPRRQLVLRKKIRIGDEKSWIEAGPCSSGKLVLRYELDYGGGPIGRQSLEISLSPRHFHLNLAPSRTFLLESEADALRAMGLGQQASVKDLLVFDAKGPIDNVLRFPDECVRHKMVDMIGDLAMAGCDLVGRFSAYRSGHRLNAELLRTLVSQEAFGQQDRLFKRCA
jgi:UDP-3-O-[3-hydroxymyristoyl] N-acetylglucosamine deacetylase